MTTHLPAALLNKVHQYEQNHLDFHDAVMKRDSQRIKEFFSSGYPCPLASFFERKEQEQLIGMQKYNLKMILNYTQCMNKTLELPQLKEDRQLMELLASYIFNQPEAIFNTFKTRYFAQTAHAEKAHEYFLLSNKNIQYLEGLLFNPHDEVFDKIWAEYQDMKIDTTLRYGFDKNLLNLHYRGADNTVNLASWKKAFDDLLPSMMAYHEKHMDNDLPHNIVKEVFNHLYGYNKTRIAVAKSQQKPTEHLAAIHQMLSQEYGKRTGLYESEYISIDLQNYALQSHYLHTKQKYIQQVLHIENWKEHTCTPEQLEYIQQRHQAIGASLIEYLQNSINNALNHHSFKDCCRVLEQIGVDPSHYKELAQFTRISEICQDTAPERKKAKI